MVYNLHQLYVAYVLKMKYFKVVYLRVGIRM
jgi:hypothetical protein